MGQKYYNVQKQNLLFITHLAPELLCGSQTIVYFLCIGVYLFAKTGFTYHLVSPF